MKAISIIIPFLNESNWPLKTIQSIYNTSDPNLFEIIAINENPKDKYDFAKFPDVKYIENEKRMGVDASRQCGVELSETPYCLIIDAHTLFYPDTNWLNKIIDCVKREPKTIWCFTCTAIGYGTEDIFHPKGEYYGADLKLFTLQEKDRPCRQIIEPTWSPRRSNKEEEIQVVLGANYAFNKDYFLHVHGLKNLRSWGSSEPFVSLKYWLSGGLCKINPLIKTSHYFREKATYSTNISDLIYNKIYILKTIFPKELEDKLIKYIPKNKSFGIAMQMINSDMGKIEKEREYYQDIFKYSVYDFCKKFNVQIPP